MRAHYSAPIILPIVPSRRFKIGGQIGDTLEINTILGHYPAVRNDQNIARKIHEFNNP